MDILLPEGIMRRNLAISSQLKAPLVNVEDLKRGPDDSRLGFFVAIFQKLTAA